MHFALNEFKVTGTLSGRSEITPIGEPVTSASDKIHYNTA